MHLMSQVRLASTDNCACRKESGQRHENLLVYETKSKKITPCFDYLPPTSSSASATKFITAVGRASARSCCKVGPRGAGHANGTYVGVMLSSKDGR
jgi:hypothetical protein